MTATDPYANFRATLEEARQLLKRETELRDASVVATAAHEAEIVRLRRVIVSIAAMVGEPEEMESIGITEACRAVMNAALVPLKLRNVRDQLADVGFDSRAQNNLDASVQVILNRLADKKEIDREEVKVQGAKNVILYIGPKVTKTQRRQTIQDVSSGRG